MPSRRSDSTLQLRADTEHARRRLVHQTGHIPIMLRQRSLRGESFRPSSDSASSCIQHVWRQVWPAGVEDHSILLPSRDHRQGHSTIRAAVHGTTHQCAHQYGERIALGDDLTPERCCRLDRSSKPVNPGRQLGLTANACTDHPVTQDLARASSP